MKNKPNKSELLLALHNVTDEYNALYNLSDVEDTAILEEYGLLDSFLLSNLKDREYSYIRRIFDRLENKLLREIKERTNTIIKLK